MKKDSVDKQYNFIYKTTNIINGKIYIGQRSTNIIPKNDLYLGSGVVLKKAIKKYGRENFKREILEFCDTLEDLDKREIYLIDKYNSHIPIGYNISKGGSGGYIDRDVYDEMSKKLKGRKHSIEQHKKVIESKRLNNTLNHSQETKDKISISGRLYKQSEEYKNKPKISHDGENNSFFGKHHSEEVKKRLSEKAKNREKVECPWCHKIIAITAKYRHFDHCLKNPNIDIEQERLRRAPSEETRLKISNSLPSKWSEVRRDNYKKENHPMFGKKSAMSGRKHKEESIIKMKNAILLSQNVQCPYCGKSGKISPMKHWHFDNCKYKNI